MRRAARAILPLAQDLIDGCARYLPAIRPRTRQFRSAQRELLAQVDALESPYPRAVRREHALDGSLKPAEARRIARVLIRHKPERILEVGSFLGLSTRWLLHVSSGWDAHITAVDPNLRHRVFDDPRETVERLNARYPPERLEIVTAFFAHAHDPTHDYDRYEPRRTRAEVAGLVASRPTIDASWNRQFDLVFIDASHRYDAVLRDFSLARSLLAPHGTIVFHDVLSWPGVARALREIQRLHTEATITVRGPRSALVRRLTRPDGIAVYHQGPTAPTDAPASQAPSYPRP